MPIDEGPREVHVRIERREGRRAEQIVWIAAVLIFVAMVKPWPASPVPEGAAVPRIARATPAVTAAPEDVAVEPCVGTWWSVEVDEEASGPGARVWVITDAVEATGPLDSRIRFVTVASQSVIGLGFCPPFHDVHDGAAATFYRLDPAARPFETTPVQMPRAANVRANTLYRPTLVPGASVAQTPWPEGRYVMRIDAGDGYQRWLGLEIRLVVLPGSRPIATLLPG